MVSLKRGDISVRLDGPLMTFLGDTFFWIAEFSGKLQDGESLYAFASGKTIDEAIVALEVNLEKGFEDGIEWIAGDTE